MYLNFPFGPEINIPRVNVMNSKNMNLGSVANKQLAIKLELARDRVGLNISVEMIATGSRSAPREVSS